MKAYFQQWEQRTFGSGYGTGEYPILTAVKKFFSLTENGRYDHEVLSKELGETVTWLLINALSRMENIEWGTSARYGWLNPSGKCVRDFIADKTVDELYEIVMDDDLSWELCECRGDIKGHEKCKSNPMTDVQR